MKNVEELQELSDRKEEQAYNIKLEETEKAIRKINLGKGREDKTELEMMEWVWDIF